MLTAPAENAQRLARALSKPIGEIGGTPGGIIAACAVRSLEGFTQGRLAPQTDVQRAAAVAAGHDLNRVLTLDDLVASDSVLFVSSPVT